MLSEIRSECIKLSRPLGDIYKVSLEDLLNGYCEARDGKDSRKQDIYLSALALRNFSEISRLKNRCSSLNLTDEECFSLLLERIEYACKYRIWQDKNKRVSATAALKQSISTEIKNQYYFANLHKNILNHTSISLDTNLTSPESTDRDVCLKDTISGNDYLQMESSANIRSLIQSYVTNDNLVSAIILDRLVFGDCFTSSFEVVSYTDNKGKTLKTKARKDKFNKSQLVQELKEISNDFIDYFLNKYNIKSRSALENSIQKLKKVSSPKRLEYINKTFENVRQIYCAC